MKRTLVRSSSRKPHMRWPMLPNIMTYGSAGCELLPNSYPSGSPDLICWASSSSRSGESSKRPSEERSSTLKMVKLRLAGLSTATASSRLLRSRA